MDRPMYVSTTDKPEIEHPEDAILKVTKTAICGSDLHLYHGNVPGMEPGQTLGHEFAGIVEKTGEKVDELKESDRAVIPSTLTAADAGTAGISSGLNVTGLTVTAKSGLFSDMAICAKTLIIYQASRLASRDFDM